MKYAGVNLRLSATGCRFGADLQIAPLHEAFWADVLGQRGLGCSVKQVTHSAERLLGWLWGEGCQLVCLDDEGA